ncbi:MAG: hypothetical protein HYS34_02720, partial [Acidobacteria bacterium]|nr:hypothetical protein [Acidobacteriota bacterium]
MTAADAFQDLKMRTHVHGLQGALKDFAALLIGLTAAFVLAEIALSWLVPPPLRYIYPQPMHQRDQEVDLLTRMAPLLSPDVVSRFIALAERLGIEHFDITWDGHINARTHRLIAESLYQRLAP